MRNRFHNFMYGRYGNDQLNRFIVTVALIILIITFFVKWPILDLVALALYVIYFLRFFSRNTSRRYAENEKYLDLTAGIRSKFGGRFGGGYGGNPYGSYNGNPYGEYSYGDADAEKRRRMREQKKIYRFFNCPNCSQKVRVPKGKGKICITCPKCRTEFVKRT